MSKVNKISNASKAIKASKMSKTEMTLRVSEIPTLIGVNPYGNIKPILLRLWKNANSKHYYGTIMKLVNKGIIENPLVRYEDVVKHHSSKYDLGDELHQKILDCRRSSNTQELQKKKSETLDYLENQKHITSPDKHKMKEAILSLSSTNYGQHHENSIIDIYSQITGSNVEQSQQQAKKEIAKSELYSWTVVGRVDGIRYDGVLVEVKNRVNRLFHKVKDYENIQVQIYLHFFKLKEGHLVEAIKHQSTPSDVYDENKTTNNGIINRVSNNIEINIIPVAYQKEIWKCQIKPQLLRFIEFFCDLLISKELQLLILSKPDRYINDYYRNNVIQIKSSTSMTIKGNRKIRKM